MGYDNKPFQLDGRINLDITLAGHTMNAMVYLKMDAHDPLLLSEGVFHQVGIILCHQNVGAFLPATSIPDMTEPSESVVTVLVVRYTW